MPSRVVPPAAWLATNRAGRPAMIHPSQRRLGGSVAIGHPNLNLRGRNFANIPATISRPTVQPKLMVGPTDDLYEQEADRVAKQVMYMAAPVGSSSAGADTNGHGPNPEPVQRSSDEEEEIQTKSLGESITPLVQRMLADASTVRATSLLQRVEEDDEIQARPLVQRLAQAGSPPATSSRVALTAAKAAACRCWPNCARVRAEVRRRFRRRARSYRIRVYCPESTGAGQGVHARRRYSFRHWTIRSHLVGRQGVVSA